jgi:adenylate cyclase
MAGDIAGYSRLMGADEEGTLRDLKELRASFLHPKIAEHRGRIVKTTGDGVLIEFPSVVDAVRCAVEIQCGMAERAAVAPADRRIDLRMGINIGDIIIDNDDIYGDGVNIAARLEALAECSPDPRQREFCNKLKQLEVIRDKTCNEPARYHRPVPQMRLARPGRTAR